MTGHFCGEIDVKTFVDFLPAVPNSKTPKANFKKVPKGSGKETSMYNPFIQAVQNSGCCPSFVFKDTSARNDEVTKAKPDLGLFSTNLSNNVVESSPMSVMDIPVEFKPQESQDAFVVTINDREKVKKEKETEERELLEKMTNNSIRHRGQQIDYASQIMSLQHRSHVFSISIIGHHARLIRWDRAGAAVSERFNYYDGSNSWLSEFLFRYSHATPEQRGFDSNVQKASRSDVRLLRSAVDEYLNRFPYQRHLAKQLQNTVDRTYPAYKVRVTTKATDGSDDRESEYIICRPFTEAISLCGRATRGYLAWGVAEQMLVFLKDTWRTDVEGSISEADAYAILNECRIPFLPVVCAGGDVLQSDGSVQSTMTQKYVDDGLSSTMLCTTWLRRHIRHRVVQHLALPLRMVRNAKELLIAIRNVLMVIKAAHKDAGILHRDISMGNIMLDETFSGILNDWDHAINVREAREGHPYRTGTWQFMSIALLKDPMKLHSIFDDVESCFWVLYKMACHYFPFENPSRSAPDMEIFDEHRTQIIDCRVHFFGGHGKRDTLSEGSVRRVFFKSRPLTSVLHSFSSVLSYYHDYLDYQKKKNQSATRIEEKFPPQLPAGGKEAELMLENVDEIIEYFDDAIDGNDWSDDGSDDAFPDKFPKENEMDSHRKIVNAFETSFSAPLVEWALEEGPSEGNSGSSMPPPSTLPLPLRRSSRLSSTDAVAISGETSLPGSSVVSSGSHSTSQSSSKRQFDKSVNVTEEISAKRPKTEEKGKQSSRTSSGQHGTRSGTRKKKD
ncbi:hypothetical protein BDY19DRAFT_941111 [Irpex rosettiformis]|uniref:Uncharacterized protein n=1 Tax=Irpex rosettiformis TaxID=378272 RepID=A0ACB8U6F8_9APHY|nr:hypothetical protein BDY19DRAFT_941111 [Irpex rosettiformis]